jgi:hypothetical protein
MSLRRDLVAMFALVSLLTAAGFSVWLNVTSFGQMVTVVLVEATQGIFIGLLRASAATACPRRRRTSRPRQQNCLADGLTILERGMGAGSVRQPETTDQRNQMPGGRLGQRSGLGLPLAAGDHRS